MNYKIIKLDSSTNPTPRHKIYKREYQAWQNMKKRCKSNKRYKQWYKDKNITVCDRWLNSFENFLKDMGCKPVHNYSLDRINNNKGYYKENCRWIDQRSQNINKGIKKDNTSGHIGIYYLAKGCSYCAQISPKNRRSKLSKCFKTLEEAINQRKLWEAEFYNN